MASIYMSIYIDEKEKKEIQIHAKNERMSLSAFFIKAAYEKMTRDKKQKEITEKMMA